jgi:drug/metabolite transporter (DMT)-like permease
MGFLLTSIAVIGSTGVWLINRWVIFHGGRGEVYGFWSAGTSAFVSGCVLLALGQPPLQPEVWFIGAMIAVAYAVGYFVVIMHCLRIGPTGPTVAVNNMGMVWPVVLGALWLKPHPVGNWDAAGLVLVSLSLILFGFSNRQSQAGGRAQGMSAAWLSWALLGWLLSGVSLTGQLLASIHASNRPVTIVFALNVLTAILLAPAVLRRGSAWYTEREMIGGVLNGVVVAIGNVALLMALRYIGPEVVFPFTIALPIMLVLVLGQFLYREKLPGIGWAASVLGVLGLTGLSLGQRL